MVKLRTLFEVISTAKSEAEAQTLLMRPIKQCPTIQLAIRYLCTIWMVELAT